MIGTKPHSPTGELHREAFAGKNRVLAGLLAIAAFFLLTEHRAYLFGVFPWLFLLACPFLPLAGPGSAQASRI